MNKDWSDAIRTEDLEILSAMLDAGADINMRDKYGQTGLMIAARGGKTNVVRLFLSRGARLDQTAKFSLSALMLAVVFGHAEIVPLLVEAGADRELRGSGAPGFAGKTALDLAIGSGSLDMVAALRGNAALGDQHSEATKDNRDSGS